MSQSKLAKKLRLKTLPRFLMGQETARMVTGPRYPFLKDQIACGQLPTVVMVPGFVRVHRMRIGPKRNAASLKRQNPWQGQGALQMPGGLPRRAGQRSEPKPRATLFCRGNFIGLFAIFS
jgi:hypothetical protein